MPTFSAPTFIVLQQYMQMFLLRFSPASPTIGKPIASGTYSLKYNIKSKRKNIWVLVLGLLLTGFEQDGYYVKQSLPWNAVGGFTDIKHIKPHFFLE